MLQNFEVNDFEWAFTNTRVNDPKDTLQHASASRTGCAEFVTFDKNLADLYSDLSQIRVCLLVVLSGITLHDYSLTTTIHKLIISIRKIKGIK